MSLCILTSFRLLSWSHFYVLKLQCVLTDMFLICCHTLWCPVYWDGWLSIFTCWFTLISYLFLPILVHMHISVPRLIWLQFLAHIKVQVSTHQHHLLHHRTVALCVSCSFCYWLLGCWLSTLRNNGWTKVIYSCGGVLTIDGLGIFLGRLNMLTV